jgi:hypothetical protein
MGAEATLGAIGLAGDTDRHGDRVQGIGDRRIGDRRFECCCLSPMPYALSSYPLVPQQIVLYLPAADLRDVVSPLVAFRGEKVLRDVLA